MFGGAHELSMDSKGRLAIPAKFRDILLRRYTPAIVVTLDSRKKLLMYPEPVWEEKAEQILKLKVAGNEALQRYQNLLLHNAEILEWDSAGRVLIRRICANAWILKKKLLWLAVQTVWSCGVANIGKRK